MQNKSLYLIQSDYAKTAQSLDKIEQIYSVDDAIVLMGDAVMWIEDVRLLNKANIFILEHDTALLAHSPPPHTQVINYAEFADVVLSYTRCISFQ